MLSDVRVVNGQDHQETFDDTHAFALDVLVGLSDTSKRLPSKYMYDRRGSELFEAITNLPEYYLTNAEMEILDKHKDQLATFVSDQPFNLVELGAGFSAKTTLILEHFLDLGLDFQFVPIDISESAMEQLLDSIDDRFPSLETTCLVSDYFSALKWLNNRDNRLNFVLFLGSSVGNFPLPDARFFLRNVWSCLNSGDYLLTGFDLKKDIDLLLKAYNDSQGVTAEFNLNVLHRINRELGGQFDVERFRHFGTYDVFSGGMESYLVSLERQDVFVEKIGRSFSFNAWEPIHMEYSYKYLVPEIKNLAKDTGFSVARQFFDSKRYFTDSVWKVLKPR